MLACEHFAGAGKACGDFVGDEEDVIFCGEFADGF